MEIIPEKSLATKNICFDMRAEFSSTSTTFSIKNCFHNVYHQSLFFIGEIVSLLLYLLRSVNKN